MKSVLVNPPNAPIRAEIKLAASKSECNRALIIDALTGFKSKLTNISEARDSQTMLRLLNSETEIADVIDAGTTMRFLTAYFAVSNQSKVMTGTARMCERPIGILVDALRILGAKITYQQQDGYPPIRIEGFQYSGNNKVAITGNVSSQYISALLLIAPSLPDGIEINLLGEVGSRPYIEMTLKQMAVFGAEYTVSWETNTIRVQPGHYVPTDYAIESDWSGASYWYSIVALSPDAEVELIGLKQNSLQGDSAIVEIMHALGVHTEYTSKGVKLTKVSAQESLKYDFKDCPDLAQTVAVCCALKQIPLTLTGIESLKIKETDRVFALQAELKKLGSELIEIKTNEEYLVRNIAQKTDKTPVIETYDDHRMAMAFAPVGMLYPVEIMEPGVVVKSYPSFWDDLAKITTISN